MRSDLVGQVLARREREQLLNDEARRLELDRLTKPQPCRVGCGRNVHVHDDSLTRTTVCARCGGRKKQAQLEREDRDRAEQKRRMDGFLRLAGIKPKER